MVGHISAAPVKPPPPSNTRIMLDSKGPDGNTPLHLALINNHIDSAKVLIKYGADCTISNNEGKTPAHLLVEKNITYLLSTVTYKSEEITDILETLVN